MILVKDPFGNGDVCPVLACFAPGKFKAGFDVIPYDCGFGRTELHTFQLCVFGKQRFLHFGGELVLADTLGVGAFFLFLVVIVDTELIFDDMQLFAQVNIPLSLVQVLTHTCVYRAFKLHKLNFVVENCGQLFNALDRVVDIENFLFVFDLDKERRCDSIGINRRVGDFLDFVYDFFRRLCEEFEIILKRQSAFVYGAAHFEIIKLICDVLLQNVGNERPAFIHRKADKLGARKSFDHELPVAVRELYRVYDTGDDAGTEKVGVLRLNDR